METDVHYHISLISSYNEKFFIPKV